MAGGREGIIWGTGSYFFSTGMGFSTDSILNHKTKTINSRFTVEIALSIKTQLMLKVD